MTINKQIEKSVTKGKGKGKSYKLDLRIHSPVSLGYQSISGLETAPALVRLAKVKGLDVIAITDSNSGEYIEKIVEAAKDTPLTVVPGVEIRCVLGECDDVVLTCLFPEESGAEVVRKLLEELQIPKSAAGNSDYICRKSLSEIIKTVDSLEGVIFPCRMDKTPQRMRAIPRLVEEFGFRAFDLAYPETAKFFKRSWPKGKFNLFSFSEAKALAQVGSRTARVKLSNPGFHGIKDFVARDDASAS